MAKQYKFGGYPISAEEKKLLDECQHEVMLKTSIPMSIFGGTFVLLSMKSGHMKIPARFGPWPKTLLGSVVGYGIGYLSSLNKIVERFCSEKPNSNLSLGIRRGLSQNRQFLMTNEEVLLTLKCRSEAFWYRELPASFLGASIANYWMHKGLLSPSQKFGIWPKTISGALIAYYIAMVFYRTTKMERFLKELPNSNMSKEYRKGFGRKITDEEIFTFSACLHEAIWFRSVPLSLLLSYIVYYAMKVEKLKMNAKYGIWPKVLTVASIGIVIGFIGNSSNCAKKFLNDLPESDTAKEFKKNVYLDKDMNETEDES